MSLEALDAALVECRACPRLVAWREQVAAEKRAAFRDETYWGRPVPGFGPADAAAADRRPRARRRTAATAPGGCSPATAAATCSSPRCTASAWPTSRPSTHIGDGLRPARHPDHRAGALRAAGQQAHPGRARHLRPLAARGAGAARAALRAVVVLGGVRLAGAAAGARPARAGRCRGRGRAFGHGVRGRAGRASAGRCTLLGCYHVSQQNTFTGRLTDRDARRGAACGGRGGGAALNRHRHHQVRGPR